MTATSATATAPDTTEYTRVRELQKAAAALAVLGATTVIAVDGLPGWELGLFGRVNRLANELEPILFVPMQLGSLFGPVVVAAGSWVVWRRWRPTAGSLVVGIAAWQAAKIVKDVVLRDRPITLDSLVRRWGTPNDGLGFVSGHSAVAFGLAGVVSPYLGRRWRWSAYGVASIVAVARIHVGAHYPLDTVGGAALGLAFAYSYNAAVGVPRHSARTSGRLAPSAPLEPAG